MQQSGTPSSYLSSPLTEAGREVCNTDAQFANCDQGRTWPENIQKVRTIFSYFPHDNAIQQVTHSSKKWTNK